VVHAAAHIVDLPGATRAAFAHAPSTLLAEWKYKRRRAVQNAVAPHQIGVATAAATFARSMGATVGLAVVGTVFASRFAEGMTREPFKVAFTEALRAVFLVSLLIAVLAFVVTLFLPALPLRKAAIGARPPPSE
jgi:hypothetical protein